MFYKNENINFRVNGILKDKFIVAIGFNDISSFFTSVMQEKVREFERDFGPIPIRQNKSSMYEFITKFYGIKINERTFYEILNLYPKTNKNKAIYGEIE